MGKPNSKGRSRGSFVMLLHGMMSSAAWHDLSGNAVKVLLHLMKLSQGNNGYGHGKGEPGELFLSEREAAQAAALSRNTASRALNELIDHGFLCIVRAGHFRVKVKHATVWRLTFEPYPVAHRGPTNEWRDWKPEQNPREQKLNGSGAKTERQPSKRALTGAKNGPAKFENGGNQPSRDGSNMGPHIDVPCEGLGRAGSELQFCAPQNLDGPIADGEAA